MTVPDQPKQKAPVALAVFNVKLRVELPVGAVQSGRRVVLYSVMLKDIETSKPG